MNIFRCIMRLNKLFFLMKINMLLVLVCLLLLLLLLMLVVVVFLFVLVCSCLFLFVLVFVVVGSCGLLWIIFVIVFSFASSSLLQERIPSSSLSPLTSPILSPFIILGFNFVSRTAALCGECFDKHGKKEEETKALDVGCAVGGSSFELAKKFGVFFFNLFFSLSFLT